MTGFAGAKWQRKSSRYQTWHRNTTTHSIQGFHTDAEYHRYHATAELTCGTCYAFPFNWDTVVINSPVFNPGDVGQ
jgi:hypothetical protein